MHLHFNEEFNVGLDMEGKGVVIIANGSSLEVLSVPLTRLEDVYQFVKETAGQKESEQKKKTEYFYKNGIRVPFTE